MNEPQRSDLDGSTDPEMAKNLSYEIRGGLQGMHLAKGFFQASKDPLKVPPSLGTRSGLPVPLPQTGKAFQTMTMIIAGLIIGPKPVDTRTDIEKIMKGHPNGEL
jgi:hypothetical protein